MPPPALERGISVNPSSLSGRIARPISLPEGVIRGPTIPFTGTATEKQNTDRAPLRAIIPPPSDRGPVSSNLKATAAHEWGHVLTAWENNESVLSMTVEASGPILGQTRLNGLVNLEKMKIILGAGAVDHPGIGAASGYQSDLAKLQFLNLVTGLSGGSTGPYIASANHSMHKHNSPEVIERASELVAYLNEYAHIKNLSESMLNDVLALAYHELVKETTGKRHELDTRAFEWLIPDEMPDEYTEIVDEKEYSWFIWHKGAEFHKIRVCPICGAGGCSRTKHLQIDEQSTQKHPYQTKNEQEQTGRIDNEVTIFEHPYRPKFSLN